MENENFVPEIDLAVTLPKVQDKQADTPGASTELDESLARHALDDHSQQRIKDILQAAGATAATAEVVDMLVKALRHDEDVNNAEATGYLRGRNEQIETALKKPRSTPRDTTGFPRYVKQSIWD